MGVGVWVVGVSRTGGATGETSHAFRYHVPPCVNRAFRALGLAWVHVC